MALSKNKIFKIFAYLIIVLISALATYSTYLWLRSIEANVTLTLLVPTVVGSSSLLGLWVMYKYLNIFIFERYKMRGKLTFYFLLVSIGSIVIVGGLMFYLIMLIENSFIEGERGVAESIMNDYRQLVTRNKQSFEDYVRIQGENHPDKFPVLFLIKDDRIVFKRVENAVIEDAVRTYERRIISYFQNVDETIFYLGKKQEILVLRSKDQYFAELMPEYLNRSFDILKENIDSLYKLNLLRKFIRPISVGSLIIFSVPILIAVFFISFFIARSISSNVEKIAQGTEIIANGNLSHRVTINSRDEIEDLARNFNRMAHKLKLATDQIKRMERLEAWQEVARRLAHEIKNPLTPIKLSAERLQYAYQRGREDFGEILEKMTNTVIKETNRLEALVNEFSGFARLPNPKLENKNLIHTLTEIAEFFRGAYNDLQMEEEYPGETVNLFFDENQLKQVIINIITNAIEACHNREKYVKIHVGVLAGIVQITISDKSGGIPEELQDKIFEPYFTTKEKGTGLGLAIAERIIMEHHGNMWFETNSEGTQFIIELPVIVEGAGSEKQNPGSG